MKTFLILSMTFLLSSTAAQANPVRTVQDLHGQAIAGVHVKLTYTSNYGRVPASITTHGSSQSPWVNGPSSTMDLGSGSQSVPSIEMCDCHVPTSTTLDYRIVLEGTVYSAVATQVQVPSQADFDTYPTSQDCIAPCQAADAADAGQPPMSTGGPAATGGAIGSGGTTATGGAPGTGPVDHDKGSGCALFATRASPALLSLALLGLAIVARRRHP